MGKPSRTIRFPGALLRPAGLGVCGCLFVLLWPWQPASPSLRVAGAISTGERIALRPHLQSEGLTLFAFYTAASAMERNAVAHLERHAALRGGARRIALPSLDAPVARQYRIQETPVFLVCD